MKNVPVFLCLAGLATAAHALPLHDPFNYTAGEALAGQTSEGISWFRAGAEAAVPVTVTNLTLSVPGLAPSTGNAITYGPGSGASARMNLGQNITSGTVYYSFAFQLSDLGDLEGLPSGGFFAGFNNTPGEQNGNPSVYGGQLLLRVNGDGGFNVGVRKSTSIADNAWAPTDFSLNETIFAVVSYEFVAGANNDIARLWLNPDSSTFGAGSAPATSLVSVQETVADPLTQIQSFIFRHNLTQTPHIIADELRVGFNWADVTPVPEPSAWALLAFGFVAVLLHRFRSAKR